MLLLLLLLVARSFVVVGVVVLVDLMLVCYLTVVDVVSSLGALLWGVV